MHKDPLTLGRYQIEIEGGVLLSSSVPVELRMLKLGKDFWREIYLLMCTQLGCRDEREREREKEMKKWVNMRTGFQSAAPRAHIHFFRLTLFFVPTLLLLMPRSILYTDGRSFAGYGRMVLYYVYPKTRSAALSVIVESVREIISLVYDFVLTLLCWATHALALASAP